MEIVLGTKLSEIYVDLYKTLGETALRRAETLPSILSRQIRGRLLGEDDA
jgi:hypothetical protein